MQNFAENEIDFGLNLFFWSLKQNKIMVGHWQKLKIIQKSTRTHIELLKTK